MLHLTAKWFLSCNTLMTFTFLQQQSASNFVSFILSMSSVLRISRAHAVQQHTLW